jgi:hypothetical protein
VTDGSTQQQGLPFQEAEGIVAERSELLDILIQRLHLGGGATALLRELYDRFRRNADWEISYRNLADWLGCPMKSTAIRTVSRLVSAGLVIRTIGLSALGGFAMNRYRLNWDGVLAALKARAIGREGWCPNRPGGALIDQVVHYDTTPTDPDGPPAAPSMSAGLGDPIVPRDSPARDTPIQSKKVRDLLPTSNPRTNPIQPRRTETGEADLPPMIGALAPEAAAGLVERLAALDDPAQVYGRVLEAIYQCVPELRESRYVAMEAARLVSDGTVYGSELRRVLLDCRAMRESRGGLRNAAGFFHAKVKVWPGWREPIRSAARARDKDEPP